MAKEHHYSLSEIEELVAKLKLDALAFQLGVDGRNLGQQGGGAGDGDAVDRRAVSIRRGEGEFGAGVAVATSGVCRSGLERRFCEPCAGNLGTWSRAV